MKKHSLHRKIHHHIKRHAHRVFAPVGILGVVCILVGLLCMSVVVSKMAVHSASFAAIINSKIVSLSNDDREKKDLQALTTNPLLIKAAQAKADDMVSKGYFAHTTPEGKEPWDFVSAAGYAYTIAGENLAMNFSDSDDVVNAWMKSTTHRANILNRFYTEIGVGTAVGVIDGKETTVVVQMFASPQLASKGTVVKKDSVAPIAANEIVVEKTVETASTSLEAGKVLGEAIIELQEAPPRSVVAEVLNSIQSAPHSFLRTMYGISAVVVLVALLFITGIEFKKRHIKHIARASILFAVMIALLIVAGLYFFAPVV